MQFQDGGTLTETKPPPAATSEMVYEPSNPVTPLGVPGATANRPFGITRIWKPGRPPPTLLEMTPDMEPLCELLALIGLVGALPEVQPAATSHRAAAPIAVMRP